MPVPEHTLPAAPPAPGGVRQRRPKGIDTAFQLTLAGSVVGAVGSIIGVMGDGWADTVVRRAQSDAGIAVSAEWLSELGALLKVVGVLGALVVLGLCALFALKMRAGRNWARIVLTGLAGFGVLNFMATVSAVGAPLGLMWSLADVAFCAAAVVYMFQPDPEAYFEAHRQPQGYPR